jgi:hypothetical protein
MANVVYVVQEVSKRASQGARNGCYCWFPPRNRSRAHFYTERRARWRSQPHVQEILDEMKANKEKWAAADAKWVAEEERRRNSPPAERLKEDYYATMVFLPAGVALRAFSLWHLHGALESRTGEGGSCFCRTRKCRGHVRSLRRLGGRLALSVSISVSPS